MKRTRTEKFRLSVVFALVCLFFTVAVARLVHLQILLGPRYSEIVDRQSSTTVDIPAERGAIYDRHGRIVANNIKRSSVYAFPIDEQELENVARYVEKTFDVPRGTARKKFGLKVRRFRWIARGIDDRLAQYIKDTAPRGVSMRDEARRTYPYGLIGKQILGFTDIDNKGQSGVELAYNSFLKGHKGTADIRRDGKGSLYRVEEKALVKPQPGQDIVLTVDWCLQEIFEEELRTGVEEFNARSGMGAFIDCRTGEILAMAHYDPEERYPQRPFKLRAVTDQFEPGSIFKAFTAAAILDAGVIGYDDTVYCEDGAWKIGRRTLHDDKELGWLTFREIMELSSNIGVAKCAIELGGEELHQTAERFGFGRKADIGLGGETGGSIAVPNRWSEYMIGALAMGHSIAVNCLQVANGFAAIANGGDLLQPHLVLCRVDHDQKVRYRAGRDLIGRVMEKRSADTLAAYLRGVVERGTATKVNSPAVAIAGKTGTAEMVDTESGRLLKNEFMASFAGFFPAEAPIVAGIVVLEQPEPVHYGGHTSGPIFRRVAERYMILNPDLFPVSHQVLAEISRRDDGTTEIPHLVGRTLAEAQEEAGRLGITVRGNAETGFVVWQYPPADRLLFEGDEILVVVESPVAPGMVMPDLSGLSIREASAFLRFAGINSRIKGRGKVINQSIEPGETLSPETVCWLTCRPI